MAHELFSLWYPSVTGWLSRAGTEVKAHCIWPDRSTTWFTGPTDRAVEWAYSMACLRMSVRRALPWMAHAPDEVRLHFSYEDRANTGVDKDEACRVLLEGLASLEGSVGSAAIFGSWARGDATARSDIDLLLTTDLPRLQTQAHFKPAGRTLGRPVHVLSFTRAHGMQPSNPRTRLSQTFSVSRSSC